MTTTTPPAAGIGIQQDQLVVPALLTTPAPTPSTSRQKTLIGKLKAWAWRATAAYFWMHWLFSLFLGRDLLQGVEEGLLKKIADGLSSVGFAPVNPSNLAVVVKWGWYLLVIGFAPHQFVFLLLYIFFFPVTLVLFVLIKELSTASTSQKENTTGLRNKATEYPAMSIAIFLLLGWFLLFGGSQSARPAIAGMIITLFLLGVLTYDAFKRVAPTDWNDVTAPWYEVTQYGRNAIYSAYQSANSSPPKTKSQMQAILKVNGWIERFYRFFTLVFRNRQRLAIYILADYLLYLVLLGFAAILFWAFAIRVGVGAENLNLLAALKLSASHFLPGVSYDGRIVLPWWAEFGPATTAWIIFVLYVGPAASVVLKTQEDAVRFITPLYAEFRQLTIVWSRYRRAMNKKLRQLK